MTRCGHRLMCFVVLRWVFKYKSMFLQPQTVYYLALGQAFYFHACLGIRNDLRKVLGSDKQRKFDQICIGCYDRWADIRKLKTSVVVDNPFSNIFPCSGFLNSFKTGGLEILT